GQPSSRWLKTFWLISNQPNFLIRRALSTEQSAQRTLDKPSQPNGKILVQQGLAFPCLLFDPFALVMLLNDHLDGVCQERLRITYHHQTSGSAIYFVFINLLTLPNVI
ncbi:hypothetical protein DCC39_12830, partial [Pueribacillus theae]